MVTPLYHCIAIPLIGGIRCPLETGDTRTSGVINRFPGFPRFLMLSSFSRHLVAMPSHHHLTPRFDHQNPQLSLYRASHVLIITVCVTFTLGLVVLHSTPVLSSLRFLVRLYLQRKPSVCVLSATAPKRTSDRAALRI